MSFIYLEPVDVEGNPKACRCIPQIPQLTYQKSWVVWKDRALSALRYYGLHEFILRSAPQPPPSTSEAASWEMRRLRAAIILKSAICDEILEDMMVIGAKKGEAPDEFNPLEDPREIFANAEYLMNIMLAGESTRVYYAWELLEEAEFSSAEDFVNKVKRVRALRVAQREDEDEAEAVTQLMRLLHMHFPELAKNVEVMPAAARQWYPVLRCIVGMAAASTARSDSELRSDFNPHLCTTLLSTAIIFIVSAQWKLPGASKSVTFRFEVIKSALATALWLWLMADSIFGPNSHNGYGRQRETKIIASSFSVILLFILFYPTMYYTEYYWPASSSGQG